MNRSGTAVASGKQSAIFWGEIAFQPGPTALTFPPHLDFDLTSTAMTMHRLLATTIAILWPVLAATAPTAAPVRAEIDALLGKLQASGCQFNRNGSWYSGSEAKDHLLRKLDYLEGRGSVQNTEQFIDLAAPKSSSSGAAYRVRCGNAAAVDSKAWLSAELAALRGRAARSAR